MLFKMYIIKFNPLYVIQFQSSFSGFLFIINAADTKNFRGIDGKNLEPTLNAENNGNIDLHFTRSICTTINTIVLY